MQKKYCTMWIVEILEFYNFMGGIVLKDVATCGGICPKSFIKKPNFPLTFVKICKFLCIVKYCKLPQKISSIELVPSIILSLKFQINTLLWLEYDV